MTEAAAIPQVAREVRRAEVVQFALPPLSQLHEMGAYEALWLRDKASFKSLAREFAQHPGSVPSDFVSFDEARSVALEALEFARRQGCEPFGIRVHGANEYPLGLRDAVEPVELLYYRGWWDLASYPRAVAVVGAREASTEGLQRARRLSRLLVENKFVVVSGLARGIDSAAHTAALEAGGETIAVIGTPITRVYPKENAGLQQIIAREHLLISQVPMLRYERQTYRTNRLFFPERNKTMSALTQATVIVEAGQTSGTLTQAEAALAQKRSLFILNSCFERTDITWPAQLEKRGAQRVQDFDDILKTLLG